MSRYIAIVILTLFAGSFSSCSFYKAMRHPKSRDKAAAKPATDSNDVAVIVPGIKPVPKDTVIVARDTSGANRQAVDEVMPMWKKRLVYKTFSGKAKMHFETADSKLEFTGHFRVKKDSVIWINITALGGMFQAARIYVTPDSFFMINNQQQEVTRMPMSEANRVLPANVDFSSLQNLILGEPLRDGTITDAANLGDSCTLLVEDSAFIQRIVYNKSDSTMRNGLLRTRDMYGPRATTEFSSYLKTTNGSISTYRVLNIQNGKDVYFLDMNFSKIDFDQPVDLPFSIPSNYTIKQ